MGGAALLGCGMRTPIGLHRASSAAAFRAGLSAITEHPFMIDRFGDPMMVTPDASLDPGLSGAERLAALAIPAAEEALAPLADQRVDVAILINFGEPRPGLDDEICEMALARIQAALSPMILPGRVGHWMGGHAGGIVGIGVAAELIQSGQAEYVLVGGVETYLTAATLEWLDDAERLHSEGNIYGFCPGEAAGFVLLCASDAGETMLDIVSIGSGQEDNLIGTEDICLGEGLADAFGAAGASLPEDQRIDHILCDMNGERYRANEYGFAVLKTTGLFADAARFETPADCWGDLGAASAPLLAGLAIEADARGYSKGPRTMIWASSEAGRRAAAVLEKRGSG